MASKKDYERVAQILHASYVSAYYTVEDISNFTGQMQLGQLDFLTSQFADWFAEDNEHFDRDRFYKAAKGSI